MKIGILETGHFPNDLQSEHGDFFDMFQAMFDGQGFTFVPYDVESGTLPDTVNDCDGWLITGSRHGAYEDHPWIAPLEEFIRAAHDAKVPQVGICFGHQIIAQALGGKVEKFPDGWAVGRQGYDWQGEAIWLNAWHQDQVIEKPKGASVLASNAFCKNAALIYEDRALTFQPHPEFGAREVDALIRVRGPGVVPETQLEQAAEALDLPVANSTVAQRIGAFFREPRNV